MAEEKQLLDGLKLVLDNGWTVQIKELIQLFDLLRLKQKVRVDEKNAEFLEFVIFIGMAFDIEIKEIEDYFQI